MKVTAVIAVAALCGVVACLFIWRNVWATAGVPRGDTSGELVSGLNAATSENQSPASNDSEQTRRKLQNIQAAVLQSMHDRARAVPGTTPVLPVDPASQARELLDQRMFNAPPNLIETTRMESELRSIVESGIMADTTVDFVCGSSICKVDLSARDNSVVEKSAVALSLHLPKSFASAVVLPINDGQRAMYVAKSSSDLAIDAHADGPQETHVMYAPQGGGASHPP